MQNNPHIELKENGFSICPEIYSEAEIKKIINCIDQSLFIQNNDVASNQPFAIRQFLQKIPEIYTLIFSEPIKTMLREIAGPDFFMVKSIYFDKPRASNWFVSWHQDITISVKKKAAVDNYTHWTVKDNQYSVQPPVEILANMYTLRIHLDNTDEHNGALMVVPGSHKNGIVRVEDMDFSRLPGTLCQVPQGGAMWMRPLLFHASSRTTNSRQRRVIHLEFSNHEIAKELAWAERMELI
jgi:ectoine hydroxylase-related dioxygenase (phytanoyl-CoA dioxygenase family)